ncbi:MAG: flagellar hook-length control protein FliK [Bacillota bacterium]|nr:flagellar hook-length control protein FliK [Bacillota bacterium]
MNANMIQLNSKKADTGNLEKISLKVDGESDVVDFQNVLAGLLGIPMEFENITDENQLPVELPLKVDIDNLKMFLANENSLKDNSTISKKNLKMLVGSEQIYLNDTKVELPQTEILEKLLSDIQADLNVKEIVASTEQKDIEFTHQSYNNMLKIKFKDDATKTREIVKETTVQAKDVEKATRPDVLGKVLGLEKAVENNEKRKSVNFTIEDDKLVKVESPLLSKIDNNEAKAADNVKVVTNELEVKEAMVESIKEAQTNGVSKVKVMLKPKELGNLEIELKMENGKMKGEIKVLNAEVKAQIEQLILPVKETLKDQNIILKDFQITVSNQSSEGEFLNQQHKNTHQHRYEPKFVDYHYDETVQENLELKSDELGLDLLA